MSVTDGETVFVAEYLEGIHTVVKLAANSLQEAFDRAVAESRFETDAHTEDLEVESLDTEHVVSRWTLRDVWGKDGDRHEMEIVIYEMNVHGNAEEDR